MENYTVLQKLGKGAQGSVFLVRSKDDDKQYVLKKVECNDENEANKAFKEAMALQELRHEFICGYKEFFVTWDKEEAAMFVCIVMDYYEMGDLAKVLKTKRQKHERIDEVILKKWIGQMLEALVFVHKKQVIHRDLKPSNIFMTSNLSISIGDFGVATVMGDARTRTRTTVGSMNWMAPEVMERPYDERSDVWSFGCIILELATCSFLDSIQISSSLFEIKQNPQCLEDILAELPAHSYSQHLCQLVRIMLRRNFQQRPTALELLNYPYAKECLLLNPRTKLVQKKKSFKAPSDQLPADKSPSSLFQYMAKNFENPMAHTEPFKILANETKQKNYCKQMKKEFLDKTIEIMQEHLDTVAIQSDGCKILHNVLENLGPGFHNLFYSKGFITAVLSAMKSNPSNEQLQLTACSLIMTLSADEGVAELIGQCGGIQDILSVMRIFHAQPDICSKCCGALWSLCVNEFNAKIVTEEKGLQDVCNVLETHSALPYVVETACSAIWSLSMEESNIDILSDVAVRLMMDALQQHSKHIKVVKSALMALASIVTCGEECAFKVISPYPEVLGLRTVTFIYSHYREEVDIVESICTLLIELAEYDDVIEELLAPSLKIPNIIIEMRKKFQSHDEIGSNTEELIDKLNIKTR